MLAASRGSAGINPAAAWCVFCFCLGKNHRGSPLDEFFISAGRRMLFSGKYKTFIFSGEKLTISRLRTWKNPVDTKITKHY
jgi:hypothetical protein